MHYIVYYNQDQKSRNLMYIVPSFEFCPRKPGLIWWFQPGLTQWAGQNQFNPDKMPTLIGSE